MTLKEKLKRKILVAGNKIPQVPTKIMKGAEKAANVLDIATLPVGFGGLKMVGKVGKGIEVGKEVARLASMNKKLRAATETGKGLSKVKKFADAQRKYLASTREEKILAEVNKKITPAMVNAAKKKMELETRIWSGKDKFKRMLQDKGYVAKDLLKKKKK